MVFSKSQTKHDASNRSQCMHPKQNERAIRKTKALLSKRKPSNRFVMHPPGKSGCIFSMHFFSRNPSRGWRRRKRARIIHIFGCIQRFALGFCKNIKKRTETLYQSFSPFMAEAVGFEPTDPSLDHPISSRGRYDHFDTLPYGGNHCDGEDSTATF